MLLVSYPELGEERNLPVYVTAVGLDYPQGAGIYAAAGETQLWFSSEGGGEVEIEGHTYGLPEGSGIYLRGTVGCRCRPVSAPSPVGNRWRVSFLTLGFGMREYEETVFPGRDWCIFDAKRGKEHRQAFREIYNATMLDGPFGGYRASALAYGLLLELNRELGGSIGNIGCKNPLVADIIAYIDRNYTGDIALEQLCEAAGGLSEQYLCRLFKQHTGLRPMEYMLRCRVNAARIYLEKTALPVSEVAVHSGFNNTSYFYRSFRKFTGMSPLAYRQEILKEE